MRIAWIAYGDLTQPTGGYVYDRLVVEGLRARGDEVDLVDPLVTTAPCERADLVVGDALCARELGPLFEGVGGARLLLVHHLPSWELERTDRDLARSLELRALAASDHVVATGVATRERLVRDGVRLPVDVVAPGADRMPRVARAQSRGVRVELLFVGSLVARKRIALVLDALEAIPLAKASALALTLVGDGGREPAHARAIADRVDGSAALRSRVTMAGVVSDEALARWLARADALVLPSSLEGYGMALTEALHAGLPVLASRPAAAAAGVPDGGAIRVFDDASELAEILRRFAHDPEQRAAMCAAAAETPLPSWSDAIAAFRRAIARAQRRRP